VLINTTAGSFTVPSGNYLRDWVITNGGTATIYVGSFTVVTAATGFAIAPGQQLVYQGPLSGQNSVYGITSAGAATAYVGQGSVVSVI
jgi:hypothetical protein